MTENYLDTAEYVWYDGTLRDILDRTLRESGENLALLNPRRIDRKSYIECARLREPGSLKEILLRNFVIGELHIDPENRIKTPMLKVNDIGRLYTFKLGKASREQKDNSVIYIKPNATKSVMVNLFEGARPLKPNATKPVITNLFEGTAYHPYILGEILIVCSNRKVLGELGLERMFEEEKLQEATP